MSQDHAATRRRSRLPWILLALVVAVIAGVTLYRQFHSPAAGSVASTETTDAAKSSIPVRPLTPAQLRALAARSPGPATAGDLAGMLEKRKRMVEASQARIRERNTAMADRFSAEKADPAWSNAHEKELASLQDSDPMHDAGAKAANFRADCRSTMCRIQGDFPNASMAADWLQLYTASAGDLLPVASSHSVTNPDGSVRVEIYGVGRRK
jgi:hypothetical protein